MRVLSTIAARLPAIVYDPDASINLVVTTYLDSPDRHYLALADAENGHRSVRVRIREYLASSGIGARYRFQPICYLERKERLAHPAPGSSVPPGAHLEPGQEVRIKQRVEVKKHQLGAILRNRRLVDLSDEARAISAELAALDLEPVLVSAYERRVFGFETGLRVTYDERLSYHYPPEGLYDEVSAFLPSVLGRPAASGPARILEVKYPSTATMPAWLEILLGGLPQIADFSKFRDGMHALDDSDGPVHLTRPITLSELDD
jgi:hypothetical protein